MHKEREPQHNYHFVDPRPEGREGRTAGTLKFKGRIDAMIFYERSSVDRNTFAQKFPYRLMYPDGDAVCAQIKDGAKVITIIEAIGMQGEPMTATRDVHDVVMV